MQDLATLPPWLRQLRPRHWLKNALVIVPLAAAHRLADPALLLRVLMTFVAFSLCASGQYVLNDLIDLGVDRTHPSKRKRPLASGQVTRRQALATIIATWTAALIIGMRLGAGVLLILFAYVSIMAAYSAWLKHVALVDAIVLAGGYAARVAAGSAAVAVRPSPWLIAFCMCLFYSLALLKRFAELRAVHGGDSPSIHARGYEAKDLPMLASFGIASGYLAVLVLAMYLTGGSRMEHLYSRPIFIGFTGILLLYWISYMWLLANRGRMSDDPVVFSTQDRRSLLLMIAMGICCLLAV